MKKSFVIFCVLAVALATAVSAFAEATPYASVRMSTTYVGYSANDVVDDPGTLSVDESLDSKDLEWDLQSNSLLGVDFEVSDAVFGKVEIDTGVDLRLAYGVWDFGPGTLTIGQDYAAFDWGAPAVAIEDNDMAGFGALSIDRSPQVTARFNQGIYVSLIKNPNDNADPDDIAWPMLAVGYDGKVGNTAFGMGAGYVTYDNGADDVDSYFVYAQAEQRLGPLALLGKIYYGRNLGDITVVADSFTAGEDTRTIAGFLALVGDINDKVGFATGVGFQTNDNDSYVTDNDQLLAYVDLPVQLAKGFQVVPTVTYVDGLDTADGTDDADTLYVGAKWQFDL